MYSEAEDWSRPEGSTEPTPLAVWSERTGRGVIPTKPRAGRNGTEALRPGGGGGCTGVVGGGSASRRRK